MYPIGGYVVKLGEKIGRAVSRHHLVLIVLLAAFLIRFYLADWNSYWNDEILSVYLHGIIHPTAFDAVNYLSEKSIHPPLYQFVLYNWMTVFGDSEIATRSLSNLYVTLSGLFLYLIVSEHWGRLLAILSTVSFSLANTAILYGLETRSYSQTIFLVTLSSYFVARITTRSLKSGHWSLRSNLLSFLGVVLSNLALSLTHYYNLFWLLSQALFVLVFLIVELPRNRRVSGLATFSGVFSAGPLLFILIWGPVLLGQYQKRAERWALQESFARSPFDLIQSSIFGPNISTGIFGGAVLAILVLSLGAVAVIRLLRSDELVERSRHWGYLHLVWWLFFPLTVVSLAFTVLGVERYHIRYFLFSFPPLSAVIVIAVFWVFSRITSRFTAREPSVLSVIGTGFLVTLLFLPGSIDAATNRKSDSRSNTKTIVQIVEQDSVHDYFLIELSFGGARSNYYLSRFSKTLRVDHVVSSGQESRGEFKNLQEALDLKQPNRILVIRNGYQAKAYPNNLLEFLEKDYRELHKQTNGPGFFIYEKLDK